MNENVNRLATEHLLTAIVLTFNEEPISELAYGAWTGLMRSSSLILEAQT